MAVDAHGLNLLRYAGKRGAFGNTVTIGRLSLHVSPRKLRRRFGSTIDWGAEKFSERLLRDFFGATSIASIDNSDFEGATFLHDMNAPLPSGVAEYDTVIDFGTIEHVFDIAAALRNIVRLCKVGGQVLHISPANNYCGHGFWQISPEVFLSLYSEKNGFAHTEVFLASKRNGRVWYAVKPPTDGQRVPIVSVDKLYVICRTELAARAPVTGSVQQSDYVAFWSLNRARNLEQASGATVEEPTGAAAGKPLTPFQRRKNRILHRYVRYLSPLNPHLVRIRVANLL